MGGSTGASRNFGASVNTGASSVSSFNTGAGDGTTGATRAD
jgi:hypothetical protein